MKIVFVLAVFALGCDSPTATDDARPSGDANVIQQVSGSVVTGDSATLTLAPTMAGSTLIVTIEMSDSFDVHVRSIDADGHLLTRDTASFVTDACGRGLEIWSAPDVPADVSELAIRVASPMTFRAHALEVSGLSRFGLIATSNLHGTGPGQLDYDPQSPAEAGNFTLSTLVTCGTSAGLGPGSPFTAVTNTEHVGIAYHLPAVSGMDGAHWVLDGVPYSKYTAVYQ